jgi:hypothetical protein
MKTAALIALLAGTFTAFSLMAATKDSDKPDKEMLRMMELLKDMDMIRQIDLMQDIQKVEPSAGAAEGTATEKSVPARKRELAK